MSSEGTPPAGPANAKEEAESKTKDEAERKAKARAARKAKAEADRKTKEEAEAERQTKEEAEADPQTKNLPAAVARAAQQTEAQADPLAQSGLGLDSHVYDCGGDGDCGPLVLSAALWLLNQQYSSDERPTDIKTHADVRNYVAKKRGVPPRAGEWWTHLDLHAASCAFNLAIYVWNIESARPASFSPDEVNQHTRVIGVYGGGPKQSHFQLVLASQPSSADLAEMTRTTDTKIKYVAKLEHCIPLGSLVETVHMTDDKVNLLQSCIENAGARGKRVNLSAFSNASGKKILVVLNQFLDDNPEIFPADIRCILAPQAMYVGGESSGKSSSVSCVISKPVTYTDHETATVAPVRYTYSYSPRVKQGHTIANITGRGLQEGESAKEIPLSELPRRLGTIMKRIKNDTKTSNEAITVEILTSRDDEPTLVMCDLPGITGNVGGEDFQNRVTNMCKTLFDNWVAPKDSTSWAFVTMRWDSHVKNENWKAVFGERDMTKDKCFDRVGVVLTRIDELSDPRSVILKLQEKKLELSDRGLLELLTSDVRKHLPRAKIFLVANADINGACDEERFEDVTKDIEKELQCKFDDLEVPDDQAPRSLRFLKCLDSLKTKRGYKRVKSAHDEILAMYGVSKLRLFVHKISTAGAGQLATFVQKFLESQKDVQLDKAHELRKEFEELGTAGTRDDDCTLIVTEILRSTRDLLYYVMCGESLPLERDTPFAQPVNLPRRDAWDNLLKKRAVTLRGEKSSAGFPSVLSQKVEDEIFTLLDESNLPIAIGQARLLRYIPVFVLKALINAPKPVSRADIQRAPSMNKAVERWGRDAFVERQVQVFIDDCLKQRGPKHLESFFAGICDDLIDVVIDGLEIIPAYRHYFQAKDQTGIRMLLEDIRSFLQDTWRTYICEDVAFECEQAAAAVEMPIVPSAPGLVRIAPKLLPLGKTFRSSFMATLGKLTGSKGNKVAAQDLQERSQEDQDQRSHHPDLGRATSALPDESNDSTDNKPKDQRLDRGDPRGNSADDIIVDDVNEFLLDDTHKIDLLRLAAKDLTKLTNAEVPMPAFDMNNVSDFECKNINHVINLQARTVILLYCFQVQLLVPKTYRPYTRAAFLETPLADDFFRYLSPKPVKSDPDETKWALNPRDLDVFDLPDPAEESVSSTNPSSSHFIPHHRRRQQRRQPLSPEDKAAFVQRYNLPQPRKSIADQLKQLKARCNDFKTSIDVIKRLRATDESMST